MLVTLSISFQKKSAYVALRERVSISNYHKPKPLKHSHQWRTRQRFDHQIPPLNPGRTEGYLYRAAKAHERSRKKFIFQTSEKCQKLKDQRQFKDSKIPVETVQREISRP